MKKIFILPVCLMSVGAIASTTFYYDSTGKCDGLFLDVNATSCSQSITKIVPPTFSNGKSFLGYYAGTTQVIDRNGNIVIDGAKAAQLFANTENPNNKKAQISLGSEGQIEVFKHTIWAGDSTSPWYYCSGVQKQYCDIGYTFYMPYAPNCWGSPTGPVNGKYDFAFNSWGFPDEQNHFESASLLSNWVDCLPCLPNVGECPPSCDDHNVSLGDKDIKDGCNFETLGVMASDRLVSRWKVYPFACKLLYDNQLESWKDSVKVEHGRIILDNGTTGKCRYSLVCDANYIPSNNSHASVYCEGVGCKDFSDGTVSTLLYRGLTATCVEISY